MRDAPPSAPSRSSVRAFFDLARAGNFPSVASNVLAALVLSAAAGPAYPFPTTGMLALTIVAACLVYAGGATFNDVFDAGFDAKHRPERAIPRGLVSRGAAAAVAALEMIAGLALLVGAGASPVAAAGLAATILLYDWLHKRWLGSVVLMAGCRVMLAVTLATLPGHAMGTAFVAWVVVLFVYIVVISLLARWEYKPGAPAKKLGKIVRKMLAFIPFVDAAALLVSAAWIPAACCAVAVPLGKWAQRKAASS